MGKLADVDAEASSQDAELARTVCSNIFKVGVWVQQQSHPVCDYDCLTA